MVSSTHRLDMTIAVYWEPKLDRGYYNNKYTFYQIDNKTILCVFGSVLEKGAQWLSGRVLDSRPRGREFDPHRRHCVVSLSKNINPSLVLVQPWKTRPFITERLLMGRKESKQTNKKSALEILLPILCANVSNIFLC